MDRHNVIFRHAWLCFLMAHIGDKISFSEIREMYRGLLMPNGRVAEVGRKCLTR